MKNESRLRTVAHATVVTVVASLCGPQAHAGSLLGDLLVSTSYYGGNNSTVAVGQDLAYQSGTTPITATNNGAYNQVFQNNLVDGSFGVTSGIVLQTFDPRSQMLTGSLDLTAAAKAQGINLTTSFPSKSELALNVSSDGRSMTFFGYSSALNALDISNSNTSAVVDQTNPTYNFSPVTPRAIGQVSLSNGSLQVINTNAYSGNNGRAVALANGTYYMVGNAGNSGKSPKPTNSVLDALSANTGVQTLASANAIIASSQNPNVSNDTSVLGQQVCPSCQGTGTGNQYGYSTTQYGLNADKTGKDDNFRGMTVFNNTLYVTKGSGGNGIDSVFQVGAAGALANGGTIPANAPITVLPGFTTAPADSAGHPFGIWFANRNTLYVADEGSGTATPDSFAGLQKWSFDGSRWSLDYVLTNGLALGQNYTVSGYLNADGSVAFNGTGDGVLRSYTTSTGGLRNISGSVNTDGTVTIFGITSTVSSGTGDQGADPNRLVAVTDNLSFTGSSQAASESFSVLEQSQYGQVIRGVALAPVPEPATWVMCLGGLALTGLSVRRRRG